MTMRFATTLAVLWVGASAGCGLGEFPSDCGGIGDWPGETFEREVVRRVNRQRAEGATCGDTAMPRRASLEIDGALVCAARLHARDMAQNGYFSHTSLDGRSFADRAREAGYADQPTGENIATGYAIPEAVMSGWLLSPGHCSGIMSGSDHIGVGFFDQRWVQVFGREASR